jgi:quercetin dioxygenase-like cupin family protein
MQWRRTMDNGNIKTLKTITNNLPPLEELAKERHCGIIEYKVCEGTCLGFNLYNIPEVSIQRVFLSKGVNFPEHKHDDSVELVIIYCGSIKYTNNGTETILYPGDFVYSKKGEEHFAISLEDSWVIAISIPREKGYPNGS